jgi:hypothetical protein
MSVWGAEGSGGPEKPTATLSAMLERAISKANKGGNGKCGG